MSISPLSHNQIASSMFDLEGNAYDLINFRPAGSPENSTLSADTSKGVLGGSVAAVSTADWESVNATHLSGAFLGLYGRGSEGNAYENTPAIASGKVSIFMQGGLFHVYVFETHSAIGAFTSILSSYTLGASLYASPYGLLTAEPPSSQTAPGVDTALAVVTKAPTSSELEVGIKLLV